MQGGAFYDSPKGIFNVPSTEGTLRYPFLVCPISNRSMELNLTEPRMGKKR